MAGTYVVQPDDTLSQIATVFHVSITDLAAWNDIENPDLIFPGQTLVVSAGVIDHSTRYVTTDGDDGNDGLTWATPMALPSFAVNSLPVVSSGHQARHSGVVEYGGGVITETNPPIEINAGIAHKGQNPGVSGDNTGTTIKLADGACEHLFAPTPKFTDWAHHVLLEDIELDGNKANNVGPYDLVRLLKPGMLTELRRVKFRNAARYGIDVIDNAVSLYLYNCAAIGCETGWFHHVNLTGSNPTNIGIYGAQVDDCGESAIYIEDHSFGNQKLMTISNMETESNDGTSFDQVVHVHTVDGSNPFHFIIDGLTAYRNSPGGGAIIRRTTEGGTTPSWNLRKILGDGYEVAFRDEMFGVESTVPHVKQIEEMLYRSGTVSRQMGAAHILSGTGSPEGKDAAPVGSLYLRTGGPGPALYSKESGTGDTGWVSK